MTTAINLIFLRGALRVSDNPALYFGLNQGPSLVAYSLYDDLHSPMARGAASQLWLMQSLNQLNQQLNHRLYITSEPLSQCLETLNETQSIHAVYLNKDYQAHLIQQDQILEANCIEQGIKFH